jgi:hypothetical protein
MISGNIGSQTSKYLTFLVFLYKLSYQAISALSPEWNHSKANLVGHLPKGGKALFPQWIKFKISIKKREVIV